MPKKIKVLLVGYIALIMFPFVYLLLLSLSTDWRFPDLVPLYFGIKNWQTILSSQSGLGESLLLSLLISLFVATSSTALGFYVSKCINYHPQKGRYNFLAYFPYVVSPVVLGSCLVYFFLKTGLFGSISGVLLAQTFIAFPYTLIFFSSFWGEKMKNYEQLASTLGANEIQLFIKVILPLAKNMIMICFFQTFLISWFEYGLTSIIGVGKVETLTIKVFLYIKESNYYFGALSCCLLMMPPVALILFNKKYIFNR